MKHQISQKYHNCTYTLKQTFVWIQKKSKKSWNRSGTVLDLKWLNLISKTLNMWAILINILTNIRNFAWIFWKICLPKQKNIPNRILVNNNLFMTSESPNIRIPILQIFVFIYWRGTRKHFSLVQKIFSTNKICFLVPLQ